MIRFLFLAFLIVPLIEIGLFIMLGQTIGLWPTLLGVVVTALIGSAVIRAQGISLIGEIRQMTSRGEMPARQIADGFMLAISGALLMTPGYFTDFVGFLLLVPTIRLAIFDYAKTRVHVVASQHYSSRDADPAAGGRPDYRQNHRHNPDVVDLDADDYRDPNDRP